jgi:hypothetical protein
VELLVFCRSEQGLPASSQGGRDRRRRPDLLDGVTFAAADAVGHRSCLVDGFGEQGGFADAGRPGDQQQAAQAVPPAAAQHGQRAS